MELCLLLCKAGFGGPGHWLAQPVVDLDDWAQAAKQAAGRLSPKKVK